MAVVWRPVHDLAETVRAPRRTLGALAVVWLLGAGAGPSLGAAAASPGPPAPATRGLPDPPREIPIGRALPEVTLTDDAGAKVSLARLRGGPRLVLFFRAASCPTCRVQLRKLAEVAQRFAAAGVEIVASSPDAPATLARLRRDLHLPIRLLSDPDEQAVSALCGGMAHCEVLVDGGGVVRWGTFTESWSRAPDHDAVLARARSLGAVAR